MTDLYASTDPRQISPVAQELRSRRKAIGLTQVDVAMRTHLTQSTVSRIESGTRPARWEQIAAIAEEVGLSIRLESRAPRRGEYVRVRYFTCAHCERDFYSAQENASWCPHCGYEGKLTRGMWPEYLVMRGQSD